MAEEVSEQSGPIIISPEPTVPEVVDANAPVKETKPAPNPEKPKRKISLSVILLSLFLIIVTALAIGTIFYNKQQTKIAAINDFESCAAAGNPIMESYPEQCSANGQTFTRKLTEEEQKKLDPTADWQAYNSIDGSYSVKYDPAKFVRNYCDDFDAGFILESRTANEIDPSIWKFCAGSSYFPPVSIRTIEKEITYKPISNSNRKTEVKNITVDGVPMTRADITVVAAEGPGDISQTILQGKYNGKIYELSARKEFTADFEQILSTFKFTPLSTSKSTDSGSTSDTSDWKTYESSEKIYSFKYPNNWSIQLPTTLDDNTYLRAPGGNPFLIITNVENTSRKSEKELAIESIFAESERETAYTEYKTETNKINNYRVVGIKDVPLVNFLCNHKYITVDDVFYVGLGFCNENDNSKLFDQILSTFKFTN